MTSALFSPYALRDLRLPNRIVVSSMCQYNSEDGCANDWHLMHYGQFAMGAAGLLMTEATHVSPVGRISPKCLGLYSDASQAALKRVVEFCHTHGVAALGIQIAHAGRKGSVSPPAAGSSPIAESEGGWQTVAPSALPYDVGWLTPLALDDAGLETIKRQFVASTERAAELGFDLAELHAGHGYLLHQFLSPLSNRRTDSYGGTLEGRMRFPTEIFAAVRAAWPVEKPLGIRLSATDWVDGGLTVEDIVAFGRVLKEIGCDFIDVTSGGLDPRQKITLCPGYQVPLAERVRKEVGIPVWAVGMITGPRQAEEIIATGKADFVAMARGMMWNPRWAWHAAQALGVDTDYASQYARCHPSRWPQAFAEEVR